MRIQSLTLLIHSVNSFPLPILDFLKNKKIALRFDGKFINFSEVKWWIYQTFFMNARLRIIDEINNNFSLKYQDIIIYQVYYVFAD